MGCARGERVCSRVPAGSCDDPLERLPQDALARTVRRAATSRLTMRLLFVKHSLVWPRSSGHDVHTFHMMKACARTGPRGRPGDRRADRKPPAHRRRCRSRARIRLERAARAEPATAARHVAAATSSDRSGASTSTGSRRSRRGRAATQAGRRHRRRPRRPALLPGARRTRCASGMPPTNGCCIICRSCSRRPRTVREHLRARRDQGPVRARASPASIDRVWVVSERDQRAMQLVAGVAHVDVLPNGVDGDVLQARRRKPPSRRTAVFWGRLDFGPNIQALEWFCGTRLAAGAAERARRAVHDHRISADATPCRRWPQRRAFRCEANVRDLRSDGAPACGGRAAVRLRRRHQEQAARSRGARAADRVHAAGDARASRQAAARVRRGRREFASALVSIWDRRRAAAGSSARRHASGSCSITRGRPRREAGSARSSSAHGARAVMAAPIRVGFVLHVDAGRRRRGAGGRDDPPAGLAHRAGRASASTSSARWASGCSARACRSSRSAASPAWTSRSRGAWRGDSRATDRGRPRAPVHAVLLRRDRGAPLRRAAARDLHRARPALSRRRVDAAALANRWFFDRLADDVNAVCEFSARSLGGEGRVFGRPHRGHPQRHRSPDDTDRAADIAGAAAQLGLDPDAAVHRD